jgi:hypothetical protein
MPPLSVAVLQGNHGGKQGASARRICGFDGKGAFLNGAGIERGRSDIGRYCASCLKGKIAIQFRGGRLAQPPAVVG